MFCVSLLQRAVPTRVLGQVKYWNTKKGAEGIIVYHDETLREYVVYARDLICLMPRRTVRVGQVVEFEVGIDREGQARALRVTAAGGVPLPGEDYHGRP